MNFKMDVKGFGFGGYPTGTTQPFTGNRDGGLNVQETAGKYWEQNYRGNVYLATSAQAGIALIVAATTGGHPTLFNPAGSGVNLEIVRLDLTYLSGNNAPTGLEWDYTTGAGSGPATGAAILTATKVAVQNAMVGGPVNSKAWWSPTTNTFTAAPAFFAPTGIALDTMVAASTNAPFTVTQMYDGLLGIAPGSALSLCSRAATTTALFQVGIWFVEHPL